VGVAPVEVLVAVAGVVEPELPTDVVVGGAELGAAPGRH